MTVDMNVRTQIIQELIKSLRECKANFSYLNAFCKFQIHDVKRFSLDISRASEETYAITFKIMGNETDNMIFVHADNVVLLEIKP